MDAALPRSAAPMPPGHWFWGHLRERRQDPLGLFLDLHARYGETVRVRFGPAATVLSLTNPEHVKHVLVDQPQRYVKGQGLERARPLLGNGLLRSEGSFWMRQRRLAQPAFHKDRVAGFARTMVQVAEGTARTWAESAGQVRDVHDDMMKMALSIVARTLFSSDVGRDAERVGRALTVAMEEVNRRMLSFFVVPDLIPTARNRAFRQALETLDGIILGLIAARRRGETQGDDLLSMLIEATDADTGEQMTDVQLRDEVMTLFLAGHETTANALTWTWYLLAQHPEVEQRLHQELDAVLGDRLPDAEDVPKLRYLGWVLNESMRLYPPAWILARQAAEPDAFDGIRIPASRFFFVMMSPWVIHRNPRLWPEPDRFDPERFSPERSAQRPKLAYLPFGAGQRMCIGNTFAVMEASLLLATLARRFRARLLPDAPVRFEPLITLRPRDGLRMRVERRAALAATG